MKSLARHAAVAALCVIQTAVVEHSAGAQVPLRIFRPERREIQVRDPARLPKARIPDVPPPATVADRQKVANPIALSLDDALQTSLRNSIVIRVLGGVTATSSGRTIYDPAIANTDVDEARARFDPTLDVQNNWSQTETPEGGFDPLDPTRAVIDGVKTEQFSNKVALSKRSSTGATTSLGVTTTRSRADTRVLPLNPETRNTIELSLTQPLLQGGGVRVNLAPIVIARINTERSYFQFKDSVQESVRGVIQAYWSLVFARTDVWARRRQVEQGGEALRRAEARLRAGLADLA